ncbi:MAG TPA: DUF3048 domain-containing protein [Actinomycetota bacterium]|nr:DUF3048 domain-containing protein [Actinomycetota bacterium]
MRYAVLGAAMAVLALVACSGPHPSAKPKGRASPAASPTAPGPGLCPLTDLPPAQGASATRAPLAVKVDDSIPQADPQSGLQDADVVFDEPVEGGLDWFLAIFQCGNPSRVGPVREVEVEDPSILFPYAPVLYANAGTSAATAAGITSTAGIINVDANHQGPAYSRDNTRQAPYNLFVDPSAIWGLKVASPLSAVKPQFSFVSPTAAMSDTGVSATAASLTFTLGPRVGYEYDPGTTSYERLENGHPQLTDGGGALHVTNVVILWTTINQSQAADASGNAAPEPVVVGQGNAMVLSGGVEHDGTWSRADPGSPVEFQDKSHNPIPMLPGNTWIHILPSSEAAFVT